VLEDPHDDLIMNYGRPKTAELHFHDAAGSMSLLFLPLNAANISAMEVCNQLELRWENDLT